MKYIDIVIKDNQFSFVTTNYKPCQGYALATLKKIDQVREQGLTWLSHPTQSPEEVKRELQKIARSIKENFFVKSQSLWGIQRWYYNVSKQEEEINQIYKKIAHCYRIGVPETKIIQGGEFLTGRVTVQELPGVYSPELEKNLQQAKNIVDRVQNTIFLSPNHLQRTKGMRRLLKKAKAGDEAAEQSYIDIRKQSFTLCGKARQNTSALTRERLTLAIQAGVGQCDEMSLCGLAYAMEEGVAAQQCYIQNGQHVFLLLGNVKKGAGGVAEYDENAVVCDPWSGAYFPASQLYDYQKRWVGLENIDGAIESVVAPLDPQRHLIKLMPNKLTRALY